MNKKHRALALALPAGALLLSAALVAPPAAAADAGCTVDGGTLVWGVKESFRSYISGTIAKGEWQASDGATYETPVFTFTGATGELDPETGAGTVAFPGLVHFTGHGGILDMRLASPSIVIGEDGTALLHLDVRSNDTTGEVALDEKQAEVGAVGAPVVLDAEAGTLAVAGAPVTLTDVGAPAFGGFYESGEELDPITVDVQLTCAAAEEEPAEEEPAEPAPAETEAAQPEDGDGVAWVPIAVGAGVVVIAAIAGLLFARHGRGSVGAAASGDGGAEG